jgi:hypothetical protein
MVMAHAIGSSYLDDRSAIHTGGGRMETELKLLIDPSDTEALRKHPLFKRYASDDRAAARHEKAAAAVLSARYTRLILLFYSWVQGAGWQQSLTEAQDCQLMRPISRYADKTLARDQKRWRCPAGSDFFVINA